MNNETTLRDWLAMNAPFPRIDVNAWKQLDDETANKQLESDCKLRYHYADIALRIRDETMPKVERKHPEWARWAARDENGKAFYYNLKPSIEANVQWMICGHTKTAKHAEMTGDTSWLPADWRNSLTPVNQ
jgi:hypothetical protein